MELRGIPLPHLQASVQSLQGMTLSSQVTHISAIRALFGFACKIGYVTMNVGTFPKRPKLPVNLAERIIEEPISNACSR